MKISTITLGAAALILSTSIASAGNGGLLGFLSGDSKSRYQGDIPTQVSAEVPPEGYKAQIWLASNGCKYTRAGRPGETVWYLIMNSLAGQSCDRLIVEKVLDDNIQMAKLAFR